MKMAWNTFAYHMINKDWNNIENQITTKKRVLVHYGFH
jgi:hypothetical protein